MTSGVIATMIAVCLVSSVVVIGYLYYMRVWFRAKGAGLPLGLPQIIGMSLRGISLNQIVMPYIRANEAGIPLDLEELIARQEAGDDVRTAVRAMVRARREGECLSLEQALAAR